MFSVYLLLLIPAFVAGVPSLQQGPLIYTDQGALRGSYLTSVSGRTFAAFQGIPYARPPTGKYRFKVFYKHIFIYTVIKLPYLGMYRPHFFFTWN